MRTENRAIGLVAAYREGVAEIEHPSRRDRTVRHPVEYCRGADVQQFSCRGYASQGRDDFIDGVEDLFRMFVHGSKDKPRTVSASILMTLLGSTKFFG